MRVTVPTEGSPLITIYRNNAMPIQFFSTTPPGTSYAAAMQADNKYASYQAFVDIGLPVLPTIRIKKGLEGSAIDEALSWPMGVVVKPLDASHGDGITVGIHDKATLVDSLEKAYRASFSGKSALLQKMYPKAVDLRLLFINYSFVAAVQRIPARVFGDGEHSIKELIEYENMKPDRGERYVSRLATIDVTEALEYLGFIDQIDRIPASGDEVSVLSKANYGSGGETEDITSHIPDWLVAMAEDVAKVSRLPLCGVDILVSEVP